VGNGRWFDVKWNQDGAENPTTVSKDIAVSSIQIRNGVFYPLSVMIGGDNTVWWRVGFLNDDIFFRDKEVFGKQFKWGDNSMQAKSILFVGRELGSPLLTVRVIGNDDAESPCVSYQTKPFVAAFTGFAWVNK
jgi:hypothetical protein